MGAFAWGESLNVRVRVIRDHVEHKKPLKDAVSSGAVLHGDG